MGGLGQEWRKDEEEDEEEEEEENLKGQTTPIEKSQCHTYATSGSVAMP
jgi:hypothetical protein